MTDSPQHPEASPQHPEARLAATEPSAGPVPVLPAGCHADGWVVGARATLLVDPTDDLPADRTGPVHVVCTDESALAAIDLAHPVHRGSLFVQADLPADEHGSGWAIRRVHTGAALDLGGLVAEIVHLGRGRGPFELVVSVRVVDDRGRPERDVPPVVYTGQLVTDAPVDAAAASRDDARSPADMRAWADMLDLLCGLLGANGLAITRTGAIRTHADVEADRVGRLEASGVMGLPAPVRPERRLPLA